MYIYIYRERERDRYIEREGEREICYIYIIPGVISMLYLHKSLDTRCSHCAFLFAEPLLSGSGMPNLPTNITPTNIA